MRSLPELIHHKETGKGCLLSKIVRLVVGFYYIYGKKRLREIDRRVRYLSRRLDELKVVDSLPADRERVYFGAWVTVENEAGSSTCWRLVGPDEADPGRGYLSIDAPLARALLGRRVDDEVCVTAPGGEQYWSVLEIRYDG